MYANAKSKQPNTATKLAAMVTAICFAGETPATCLRAPTADVFARVAETAQMATVMDMSDAKPISA